MKNQCVTDGDWRFRLFIREWLTKKKKVVLTQMQEIKGITEMYIGKFLRGETDCRGSCLREDRELFFLRAMSRNKSEELYLIYFSYLSFSFCFLFCVSRFGSCSYSSSFVTSSCYSSFLLLILLHYFHFSMMFLLSFIDSYSSQLLSSCF